MGQRIAKHQYAGNAWEKSTYYVRDAQGNVLATYNKENPGTATMKVTERDIYGSSRVGMYKKEVEMISASTPSTTAFQHETGLRQYELSNHLGNVLAVITDRKRPLDLGDYDVSGDGINDTNTSGGAADNRTDYYQAEIIMSGDYSPFGVTLDGRTFSSSSYKYGFNGKELDNEIKGDNNSYDFGARLYDNRLGRFLIIDRLSSKYPMLSSYCYAANTPIIYIDENGDGPKLMIYSLGITAQVKAAIQKGDYASAYQMVLKLIHEKGQVNKMLAGEIKKQFGMGVPKDAKICSIGNTNLGYIELYGVIHDETGKLKIILLVRLKDPLYKEEDKSADHPTGGSQDIDKPHSDTNEKDDQINNDIDREWKGKIKHSWDPSLIKPYKESRPHYDDEGGILKPYIKLQKNAPLIKTDKIDTIEDYYGSKQNMVKRETIDLVHENGHYSGTKKTIFYRLDTNNKAVDSIINIEKVK